MAIQCTGQMHYCLQKSVNVIGHVTQKISAVCSIFIQRGGSLTCIIINSHRQHPADLPQSGLQIPCKLEFKCDSANNNYMKIILVKFKFGGLVMICQFTKFSFLPKFVVIWYSMRQSRVLRIFALRPSPDAIFYILQKHAHMLI